MQTETLQVEILPIEKLVENNFISEIEKHEIRKEALIEKKNECLSLKINGQDDKEGYTRLRETRLNQKATRIVIEKICKAKRDPLNAESKAWSAIEKEYTSIVSEGEDYLQKEEDAFNAEKEKLAAEKQRKNDAQFTERSVELTKYGANLIEGYFVLGDIKFEASSIREVDADIWEQNIKPKYKEIFDEVEKVRIENEKKLAQMEVMKITIFNSRYDQILHKSIDSENFIRSYKNEILTTKSELINMTDEGFYSFVTNYNNDATEAFEKEKAEKQLKERADSRKKELYSLGFAYNGQDFIHDAVTFLSHNITDATEEKWNELIEIATRQINEIKEEARLKQIAEQKLKQAEADKLALGAARLQTLGDYENNTYTTLQLSELEESQWHAILVSIRTNYNDKKQKELEDKQALENEQAELKKAEELAKAGDKAQWENYISKLQAIAIPIAKSGKYRTMVYIAKEKTDEIITLKP